MSDFVGFRGFFSLYGEYGEEEVRVLSFFLMWVSFFFWGRSLNSRVLRLVYYKEFLKS